jgi:Circularly permutated YpsA SLOG family
VRPEKLVSGGQTGADRAALDVALELGLQIGGWVPNGRLAEDGPIPERYTSLAETESSDPAVRTGLNVRDADATLIVSHGPLTGGSLITLEEALRRGKPILHLDFQETSSASATTRLRAWLDGLAPHTLNVAGPRASEDPMIYGAVVGLLRSALA